MVCSTLAFYNWHSEGAYPAIGNCLDCDGCNPQTWVGAGYLHWNLLWIPLLTLQLYWNIYALAWLRAATTVYDLEVASLMVLILHYFLVWLHNLWTQLMNNVLRGIMFPAFTWCWDQIYMVNRMQGLDLTWLFDWSVKCCIRHLLGIHKETLHFQVDIQYSLHNRLFCLAWTF